MTLDAEADIEIYWMPGCSSCLRLKEFVERTGLPFTAVNVAAEPERAGKLRDRGMRVPALCVGTRCVNGVHLATVAELLGVDYVEPDRLDPATLAERYRRIIAVLRAAIAQIAPEHRDLAPPGRDRSLIATAGHAACVMRYFVGKYDDAEYSLFFDDLEPAVSTPDELDEFAAETLRRFDAWWAEAGESDPLDEVVEVYWGHRTLHEALEREVWHTAQHTRQVIALLEQAGVVVGHPLSAADLDCLPLPERVFE